jgi:hypothetical protein
MTELVSHQFPHPELTLLQANDEKPNHSSIKLLHKQINANAMSIPSVQGSGTHGHLFLTVSAAAYQVFANVGFNLPTHPGPAPVHAAAATAAAITETNRQYSANLKEFQVFTSTEASLSKQLIAAVPSTYIDELSHEELGFANVSTLALLTHLDTTYGTITADDLTANLKALDRAWSTEQPIEDLWLQLRACRLFAATRDPITEATAVRSAIANLENTGEFIDALKDWRKIPDADRDIARLKTEFNRADTDRLRNLTTRTAGFAGAATQPPNATPAPTLAEIAAAAVAAAAAERPPPSGARGLSTLAYCWSHGLGPNPEHTSPLCRHKKPGHKDNATVCNMLGGCNTIHRRHSEIALMRETEQAHPNRRRRQQTDPRTGTD